METKKGLDINKKIADESAKVVKVLESHKKTLTSEELKETGNKLTIEVVGKLIGGKFMDFEDLMNMTSMYVLSESLTKHVAKSLSSRDNIEFTSELTRHRVNLAYVQQMNMYMNSIESKANISRNLLYGKIITLELLNILLKEFATDESVEELLKSFSEDDSCKSFDDWFNNRGNQMVLEIFKTVKDYLHSAIRSDYDKGYNNKPLYESLFDDHYSFIKYETIEECKNFVQLLEYNDHEVVDILLSQELIDIFVNALKAVYKLAKLNGRHSSVINKVKFLFSNRKKWGSKKPAAKPQTKKPTSKKTVNQNENK